MGAGVLPAELPRLWWPLAEQCLAGQAALPVAVGLGGHVRASGGEQPRRLLTWRLDSISGAAIRAGGLRPRHTSTTENYPEGGEEHSCPWRKDGRSSLPCCGPQGLHLPSPPLGKPGKTSARPGWRGRVGRGAGTFRSPRWHASSPELRTDAHLDSVPGSTISAPLKIQKQNTKPKISRSINAQRHRHTQRQQRSIVSRPTPNFSWFYIKIWIFHLVIFNFPGEKINTILELHTHFTHMSSFAVIGLLLMLRIREDSSWPSGLVAANP